MMTLMMMIFQTTTNCKRPHQKVCLHPNSPKADSSTIWHAGKSILSTLTLEQSLLKVSTMFQRVRTRAQLLLLSECVLAYHNTYKNRNVSKKRGCFCGIFKCINSKIHVLLFMLYICQTLSILSCISHEKASPRYLMSKFGFFESWTRFLSSHVDFFHCSFLIAVVVKVNQRKIIVVNW